MMPVVIGDLPLTVTPHGWCKSFRPHKECPGSPCDEPPEVLKQRSRSRRATKHNNTKVASRDSQDPCLL